MYARMYARSVLLEHTTSYKQASCQKQESSDTQPSDPLRYIMRCTLMVVTLMVTGLISPCTAVFQFGSAAIPTDPRYYRYDASPGFLKRLVIPAVFLATMSMLPIMIWIYLVSVQNMNHMFQYDEDGSDSGCKLQDTSKEKVIFDRRRRRRNRTKRKTHRLSYGTKAILFLCLASFAEGDPATPDFDMKEYSNQFKINNAMSSSYPTTANIETMKQFLQPSPNYENIKYLPLNLISATPIPLVEEGVDPDSQSLALVGGPSRSLRGNIDSHHISLLGSILNNITSTIDKHKIYTFILFSASSLCTAGLMINAHGGGGGSRMPAQYRMAPE